MRTWLKKTQTTWMKIVSMIPNAQKVTRAIPYFEYFCNIHIREREIMEVKYRRNVIFLETKKIVECSSKSKSNQQ